jgi:hypothetical protein
LWLYKKIHNFILGIRKQEFSSSSIAIKMQAQKLQLFALVASLLILQLSPLALARPRESRSTGTSSSSSSSTEDSVGDSGTNGGVSAECLGSIFNVIIGQVNTFIPAIGLGFAACGLPCGTTGTPGACAACITGVIPGISIIPTNLPGCS